MYRIYGLTSGVSVGNLIPRHAWVSSIRCHNSSSGFQFNLASWYAYNLLAKKDIKSVVQKEGPKTIVSLRFFEKEEEEADEIEDIPIPVKNSGESSGLDGYDGL